MRILQIDARRVATRVEGHTYLGDLASDEGQLLHDLGGGFVDSRCFLGLGVLLDSFLLQDVPDLAGVRLQLDPPDLCNSKGMVRNQIRSWL